LKSSPVPELKEISKYVSSKDKDVKGYFGTNEIVLCNIFPASCRGSSQLSPISYEAIRVLLKILFLMFCCLLICLVVTITLSCILILVLPLLTGIYRNMELNTIKKLDYPKSMSIPSDSYKTRVEAHSDKNFRCDCHYVSQIQTQQQNKEDKDDQDISNENIQSRSVNESENPDNLEGKVGNESENPDNLEGKAGRSGVWDSDCHNEMHCITGIQSGGALFHVKQSCSKGNVNERQKSNIMDMDSSRATLSIGTPVLLNTTGPRKRGRPRKIKEPITTGPRKRGRPRKIKEPIWNYNNNTNDCRGDFADKDCDSDMQSAGTPVLVNTMEPKGKPVRPRLVGSTPVLLNTTEPRKRGRPRKIKEPNTAGPRKSERPRKIKEPNWNYNNNTNDCRGYFADKDCESHMQSAGTPVLVNTMEPKRKPGRPRLFGVKRNSGQQRLVGLEKRPGRPRKMKEPICSNDNHHDEKNYTDIDRD